MKIATLLLLPSLAAPTPAWGPEPEIRTVSRRPPVDREREPLFTLESADPAGTWELAAALPIVRALLELPVGGGGLRELRAGWDELRSVLGAAPPALLSDLAGDGLVASVALVRFEPLVLVRAHAADPIAARARLALVLARLADRAGSAASPADLRQISDGVEWWSFDDALVVAHAAGVTAVSNDREAAFAALAAGPPAGEHAGLSASLDLERLRALAALGGDPGLRDLAAVADDPEARIGLGATLASVGAADRIEFELAFEDGDLALRLGARGDALRTPDAGPSALGLEPSPADLARVRVHRDLSDFVRATEALADERSAELARQLGELELLLGGLDLRREVLPALGSDWQVVARELEFGDAPRPELELPGAALLVPLGDPHLAEPLLATFQNLVSLSNVELAQQGGGRMRLLRTADLPSGGLLCSAHLVAPRPGEPVDAVYNLCPTIAAVGGWLLLGTHEALVLDLLDELPGSADGGSEPGTPRQNERLGLDLGALAGLLERHRETVALTLALRRGADEGGLAVALEQLAARLREQGRLALELTPLVDGAQLELRLGGRSL